jgi:branched-chain amino acid transport system substrate-binding protein
MTTRRYFLSGVAGVALALSLGAGPAAAQNETLKVGVLGVMSGPSASWGLVNRYSAEARAKMINEAGGFQIGDKTYDIEIVSIDDRNDPKVSVSGAERLIHQEGVNYIIGPNVDTTAAAIVPVVESGGAINVPYAFSRDLYSAPHGNSILGMIASYQAGPVIYKYLAENNGVQSIAFISRNESDSINQRDEGIAAAEALGLNIASADATYEAGTTDFFPIVGSVIGSNPDLIVLSGVAPSDAPLLIKSLRELGYQGLISTETAQDAKVLAEVAGPAADGFISVGGASTPEIRSPFMEDFAKVYEETAGEWNDEAGTKVYALDVLLEAIKQAGPEAIEDVEVFKANIDNFKMPNPFLKDNPEIGFVGSGTFGQNRQMPIPMVVTEFRDGEFQTLFVGSVE